MAGLMDDTDVYQFEDPYCDPADSCQPDGDNIKEKPSTPPKPPSDTYCEPVDAYQAPHNSKVEPTYQGNPYCDPVDALQPTSVGSIVRISSKHHKVPNENLYCDPQDAAKAVAVFGEGMVAIKPFPCCALEEACHSSPSGSKEELLKKHKKTSSENHYNSDPVDICQGASAAKEVTMTFKEHSPPAHDELEPLVAEEELFDVEMEDISPEINHHIPTYTEIVADPLYKAQPLNEFNGRHISEPDPPLVSAMQGHTICDITNHSVKHFNDDGIFDKFILHFDELQALQPEGLIRKFCCYVVSLSYAHIPTLGKLYVCHIDGQSRSYDLPFHPGGLVRFPDDSNDLLCTSQHEPTILYRLTPSRKRWANMAKRNGCFDKAKIRITVIPLSLPQSLIPLDGAMFIASNKWKKNIILSLSDLNAIVVFDTDGNVKHTFGAQDGAGDGVLETPMGLDCLSDGSILVVDQGHNRVIRLTPQFEWGGILIGAEEGLIEPSAIFCRHSNKTLFLSHSTGGIKEFKYERYEES